MTSVLTCAEIAKRLRCSKAQVSKIINGKMKGVPPIKVIRLGRRPFVLEPTLEEWLRERERASCNVAH